MVSFTDHYNAISIDRVPSKTKIGKISWYFNNYLLCKPVFSSATNTFLFLLKQKNKKKPNLHLQQVTGGNTSNLFLKIMLRYFLKIPPLKKILQFQDRVCFFFLLKTLKNNHSSASDWWRNTNSSLKESARTFSKNSTTQKILKFYD